MFFSVSSSEEEPEKGKPNKAEDVPKGSTICDTIDGSSSVCIGSQTLILLQE